MLQVKILVPNFCRNDFLSLKQSTQIKLELNSLVRHKLGTNNPQCFFALKSTYIVAQYMLYERNTQWPSERSKLCAPSGFAQGVSSVKGAQKLRSLSSFMDWFNLLGFDDFLMSFVIVSVSGLTMLFRKFYETPDDFTRFLA